MSSTHRDGWGSVFLQDCLSDGRSEHTVGITRQFYDSQWSPIFELGQNLVLFWTKQKRASISTSIQMSQLWSVILNMISGLNQKSGSTANHRFVSTFTHYAWFIRTPSSFWEKSITVRFVAINIDTELSVALNGTAFDDSEVLPRRWIRYFQKIWLLIPIWLHNLFWLTQFPHRFSRGERD